jgi:hypothetical protein
MKIELRLTQDGDWVATLHEGAEFGTGCATFRGAAIRRARRDLQRRRKAQRYLPDVTGRADELTRMLRSLEDRIVTLEIWADGR